MAERTKGSRFVVTRRMITTKSVAKKIDHQMDVANRLYNLGVKHYAAIVNTLLSDPDFDSLLREYHKWFKENKGSEKENPYTKTISLWLKTRELNEYNLHAWFGATAKKTFPKCLNSMIVQKLASNLYAAIKKVIFSSGKEIHFRKYGQTCTLEGKNNSTGIVYKEETDSVVFAGLKIPLKEIRDNDKYLQTAMAYGKVKYCRIIRKPFKTRYRYFLQIVMEGVPPDKIKVDPEKRGVVGQDPGISNSTFCGKTYAGFETLSKGIEKYTKEVREAAITYSRRRRMANPQNYEENGTIKTGVKLEWNHTKGMQEALFELKNAYRKASEHTKNYNGWLSNRIVEKTSILKQESMDYKTLAKRSTKPAKRKPKPSVIKTKSGKTKTVYKFKTKKRFGGSILKRSPGAFALVNKKWTRK